MINKIWPGYKDQHHIWDSFRGQGLVTASSAVVLSSSLTPPSHFYNSLNIWHCRFLCFQQNIQYIAHICGGLKKPWTRAVELAAAGKPAPPLPPPLSSPLLSEPLPPKSRHQDQLLQGVYQPWQLLLRRTVGSPSGLWISIHFFRIRIQRLRLKTNTDTDTDTDPDPIRIQGFNDQNLKQNYSWKFFYFFFIKNCNLPIPRPP